jgi:hypothetical protein
MFSFALRQMGQKFPVKFKSKYILFTELSIFMSYSKNRPWAKFHLRATVRSIGRGSYYVEFMKVKETNLEVIATH